MDFIESSARAIVIAVDTGLNKAYDSGLAPPNAKRDEWIEAVRGLISASFRTLSEDDEF